MHSACTWHHMQPIRCGLGIAHALLEHIGTTQSCILCIQTAAYWLGITAQNGYMKGCEAVPVSGIEAEAFLALSLQPY